MEAYLTSHSLRILFFYELRHSRYLWHISIAIYLVAPQVSDAAREGGVPALGDCHVGDGAQELRRQSSGS